MTKIVAILSVLFSAKNFCTAEDEDDVSMLQTVLSNRAGLRSNGLHHHKGLRRKRGKGLRKRSPLEVADDGCQKLAEVCDHRPGNFSMSDFQECCAKSEYCFQSTCVKAHAPAACEEAAEELFPNATEDCVGSNDLLIYHMHHIQAQAKDPTSLAQLDEAMKWKWRWNFVLPPRRRRARRRAPPINALNTDLDVMCDRLANHAADCFDEYIRHDCITDVCNNPAVTRGLCLKDAKATVSKHVDWQGSGECTGAEKKAGEVCDWYANEWMQTGIDYGGCKMDEETRGGKGQGQYYHQTCLHLRPENYKKALQTCKEGAAMWMADREAKLCDPYIRDLLLELNNSDHSSNALEKVVTGKSCAREKYRC